MAKDGLRAGEAVFSPELVAKMSAAGNYIGGGFALEQGFIFSAMILSAATVHLIERNFVTAGIWCASAAGLAAVGLIHSYALTPADSVAAFGEPAWRWCLGYLAMTATFFAAKWVVVPEGET
jgi:AGZA family xanthine/uracil permease-like MFS transporter